MFESIIGGFVWAAANYLYADMRRKGKRGLSRFFLFWMGMPTNWLWLFLIKEGSEPEQLEAPDDAETLLEEIRQEQALGRGVPDRASVDRGLPEGAEEEDSRRIDSPSGSGDPEPESRATESDGRESLP